MGARDKNDKTSIFNRWEDNDVRFLSEEEVAEKQAEIYKIKGLRTQETKKFEAFFEIVQRFARERNSVFFLDAADNRHFETDILEGEDLMGWLIPFEKQEEFEKEFNEGEISEKWDDYFCFAIWENENNPVIKFTI